MDPEEYSEGHLRGLFYLLSARFKSVPVYTVYVETSVQDLLTPEEREGPGYSEMPENPKAFKHPYATIEHSTAADTLYMFLPESKDQWPMKVDLRIAPGR
jgi:hypothetical protein